VVLGGLVGAQMEVPARVVVMRTRRWWPCWLRRAATLMWSQVRNGGHGSNMQQCIQIMHHLVQLGLQISRLYNLRCARCRMPCNITPSDCALSCLRAAGADSAGTSGNAKFSARMAEAIEAVERGSPRGPLLGPLKSLGPRGSAQ
jgi:hypothetical protein